MLKVSDNKIYLTRGDSMTLEVLLTNEEGYEYPLEETDKLYFRLKQTPLSKDILIEKELQETELKIVEDDTKDLKFATYCYEIELVTKSNDHFTVIENATFEIGMELENHEKT